MVNIGVLSTSVLIKLLRNEDLDLNKNSGGHRIGPKNSYCTAWWINAYFSYIHCPYVSLNIYLPAKIFAVDNVFNFLIIVFSLQNKSFLA